jgi:hypothetical protein
MIGQQPRGAGMDAYSLAFAPLRAAQDTTMGALQQVAAMQELEQKPRLAEQASQDSFLRAMGDLLPPEVLDYIIRQRMPDIDMMGQGQPQLPPGMTPEQVAMFQEILNNPR